MSCNLDMTCPTNLKLVWIWMWVPLLVWFPDCVIFFVQCNSWLHNGLTNSKFHCFFCSSLCLQNSHGMNGWGFWNDCSKMQATDVFSFIVKLELFLYNKSLPITLVFWFVTCGAARSVVYIELLHLRLGLTLDLVYSKQEDQNSIQDFLTA